jgi:hypothetical protein
METSTLIRYLPLLTQPATTKRLLGLFRNSLILGPVAVVFFFISYLLIRPAGAEHEVPGTVVLLAFIVGGPISSIGIFVASCVVFLPIYVIEFFRSTPYRSTFEIFARYFPVISLLSLLPGTAMMLLNNWELPPPVPLSFLPAFHLTASTAWYLFSRMLK